MAKVKLNLQSYSITELFEFARNIVTALTGNADFMTPDPPLTDVSTAADELETAYNESQVARQDSQEKTTIMYDKEDALSKLITRLGLYVENTSTGDEAKIQSAGMDVRDEAGASAPPAVPHALSATAGDMEGEIDLHWEPVSRAKSYIIQQSNDPPGEWTQAGVVTKSKHSVLNLTSGDKYWFRVAAVGTAGQSGWSDPATRIAP